MRKALALVIAGLLLLAGAASAEFVFSEDYLEDMEQTPAAPSGSAAVPAQTDGAVEILITAAGDVTIGGNMRGNVKSNMYTKVMDAIDGNFAHFFANVYDIFSQDDLTIVNFEGTLTESTRHKDNDFCFRAPADHVRMLTLGSVEAVAFENNHVMDFYEQGYNDTIQTFGSYGIVYASEDDMGVYETKGVSIAMLAYQTFGDQYERLSEKVPQDIAAAKASHDIVIVSYHWGNEKYYAPTDRQVRLGRLTIDAGADLVLGHHSHRINPIERYNGKYIVYSLGNCSFSGNSRPDDMDTFLFQQKFIVRDGQVSIGDFRIIPCSISSISGLSGAQSADNDLAVTPFEPGSKAAQRVVDTMLKNGAKLDYAVEEYPTQWP